MQLLQSWGPHWVPRPRVALRGGAAKLTLGFVVQPLRGAGAPLSFTTVGSLVPTKFAAKGGGLIAIADWRLTIVDLIPMIVQPAACNSQFAICNRPSPTHLGDWIGR